MELTPKNIYRYIVNIEGLYLTSTKQIRDGDGPKGYNFSIYKGDAKRFGSLTEAGEISRKIGGCRIMRMNILTMELEDVYAAMRRGPEREWTDGQGESSA